jgi:hypothetical protein
LGAHYSRILYVLGSTAYSIVVAKRRWQPLVSGRAIFGWLLALGGPILWLIDRLSELQFVHDMWPFGVCYVRAVLHGLAHANILLIPLAGIGWLTILVMWPEVMSFLAKDLGEINILLRTWRPLNEQEKDAVAGRLLKLGQHTIQISHNDAIDCADLADDFVEVFQRAGWSVPSPPGVSWDSIGARGIAVSGRSNNPLSTTLSRVIEDTTYLTVDGTSSIQEHPSTQTLDIIILVAPMRRRRPGLTISHPPAHTRLF